MATNFGSAISGAIPSGSVVGLIAIFIIVGMIVIIILALCYWLIYSRRKWHLKVEIKLPRSDGNIVASEWGKGFFSAKRGAVYIKRPGAWSRAIPLKIFDPKRYLQGTDTMTVIQLSPVDYRPVLPSSFLEHEVEHQDDKTGEITVVKESILNIKCDTGHSRAWAVSFENAAKNAYSIKSFMTQFQTPIAIAIVVMAVFVGITALWTQMPK
ncbi:MAG: hypothetical protein ACTSQ4_02405 [Candidatus Heimdallarchaeaceae archaeon]